MNPPVILDKTAKENLAAPDWNALSQGESKISQVLRDDIDLIGPYFQKDGQ